MHFLHGAGSHSLESSRAIKWDGTNLHRFRIRSVLCDLGFDAGRLYLKRCALTLM